MQRFLLLFVALAMSAPSALAQSDALSTALDHLQAARTTLGLTEADLGDVAVTDEYVSRHSGVTHLYLRQKIGDIEVYNGRISAHVAPDGRVAGVHSTFVADAARRASAATPALTAEAAVEAAARHLGLTPAGALSTLEPADDRHRALLSDGGISLEPIPVQLVYFVTDDGALRLAWDLSIYALDAQNWWSLRVDAETGAVLDQNDWVIHDEWPKPERLTNIPPLAESPVVGARSGGGASYNVWALPLESPTHGPRSLEVDPHDLEASPNGWHDTGSVQYTTTRGNNVHAYEDRDANNSPGYAPDGGPDLAFDFPFDPALQPEDYEDVAITNLFYWNNLSHDVFFHYGFDEAAGNFQATNFTPDGAGNDYVRAEAQDGSGVNNANFGTPPDGSNPRMQMFQWEAPPQLGITAPEAIAGFYTNQQAAFGPAFPPDPEPAAIVPVVDFEPFYDTGAGIGCDVFANEAEIEGNIALIQRGSCEFGTKVLNAEDAGAVGVIIHNCQPGAEGCSTSNPGEGLISMGPGADGDAVTIPSTFVQQSSGLLFVANSPGVEGYVQLVPINRDSDLDNGVIVHEYGHGVSNRLTGGPSAAGCLTNEEQMGEGWSDYLALIMTMREGDTPEQGRGIGTYVEFQDIDGPGIRPHPYSADMTVNPHTYTDIGSESVPHGVGSVWAAMLWDMTWSLIEAEGFDPDLVRGTGGNNIALRLVMDGMKLQPCGPGFVDGRDAILEADTLLHDGAYSDRIWEVFARRGLGYSADQGSPNSVMDGSEAFDLPPGVTTANEEAALPNGYALSAAYPNPFSDRAQITLEVADAQDVRVAVYDVMGREVARLHDGPLAPGTSARFELDGGAFASGVYLVRVTGEAFAETRRVTLLR